MKKIWTIADSITLIRIIGTLCLVFMHPFSVIFYVFYTISGVTDALDGFVARKTGTSGDFGAKLDSLADLLFYSVMMFKVLPCLIKTLTIDIWITVAVALFIRMSSYITAALKFHKFSAMHTYMNKLTGIVVFLIPYVLPCRFAVMYCRIGSFVAIFASLEELVIHIRRAEYDSSIKSIFIKRERLG